MKAITLLVASAVAATSLFAAPKAPKTPQQIFAKKCLMCHVYSKPESKAERKKMVAPPITTVMSGVVITIDAVEGPLDDKELREESIAFIKDYLYYPSADKRNCEDHVEKKFGRMPSLKGFLSQKDMDIVVPWVYDNFKPVKKNGKYAKRH